MLQDAAELVIAFDRIHSVTHDDDAPDSPMLTHHAAQAPLVKAVHMIPITNHESMMTYRQKGEWKTTLPT